MSSRIEKGVSEFVGKHIRNPHFVMDQVLDYPAITFAGFVLHGITTSLVSRFDQSQSVKDAISTFQPKEISIWDRIKRETTFFNRSRHFDWDSRSANGYRLSLLSLGSEFSSYLNKAYTEYKYKDHGHEHFRRVKDFVRLIFVNSPELKISWTPVIDAMASWSHTHDIHQVLVKIWNDEKGLKMIEKDGHDFAAAVMNLATFREYAKERGITEPEAWIVKAIEAWMCIDHDDSKPLQDLFKATKRGDDENYAHEDKYNDEDETKTVSLKLIEELEKGLVDTKTLSAKQIVKIMEYKLQNNIAIAKKSGETTKHGLLPDFEKQFPVIEEFLTKEEYNKPLFDSLTPDQRESMQNARALVIAADRFDMFAPFATTLRKLMVSKSVKRTAFVQGKSADEIISEVERKEYDFSDTHRLLFEIMTIDDIYKGTGLEDSLFLRNIFAQHQYASLLHYQRFGDRFLHGDLTVISETFDHRESALTLKILKKLRIPYKILEEFKNLHTDIERIKAGQYLIWKYGQGTELQKKYEDAIQGLEAEKSLLIKDKIMEKPENKGKDKLFDYGDAVKTFDQVCEYFLEKIKKSGTLSEGELLIVEGLVGNGDSPPLGNSSFDSVGNLSDMKTLISHRESILVKLLLKYPGMKNLPGEGQVIVDRKGQASKVRKEAFERLGLGYLLGKDKQIPGHLSYETGKVLWQIRRAGLEPELINIVDEVLNSNPHDPDEINTLNRAFMCLGFDPAEQKLFQTFVWDKIEQIFVKNNCKERFDELKRFAELAYSTHIVRRTGDEFINHPLAITLLEISERERSGELNYSQNDLEDIEARILHDLVEDNPQLYAFVRVDNGYRIVNKENEKEYFTISHDQFEILTALTRIKGRDEEWLNQIISLPLPLRARTAKIKIQEIMHNLYTGKYNNYIEALTRTEELERTLVVLSLVSSLSLSHPLTTVREFAGFISGLDVLRMKFITPSICASAMKKLYLFLIEEELIKKVNELVKREDSSPVVNTANLIKRLLHNEDNISQDEYSLRSNLSSRLFTIDTGESIMSQTGPITLLKGYMQRNRLNILVPEGTKMPSDPKTFRPLGMLDLEKFIGSQFSVDKKLLNPFKLGSLSSIWYQDSKKNRLYLRWFKWIQGKRKEEFNKALGIFE